MMKKNDFVFQARKEIFINKNYENALTILNSIEESEKSDFVLETTALALMENKQYKKAAQIYTQIGELYNAGFCELLLGNRDETAKLWERAADSSPLRWGKCILDYIKLRRGPVPTYLQVRNYLETDMGYFIEAGQLKYAENLMQFDELFLSVNLEAYKLIGRVLLNYGFLNQSRKYLIKSLGVIPNDAETFFCLAKYNYQIGAYKEAQKSIEKCLDNNQSHTPARKLLEKVKLKQKI